MPQIVQINTALNSGSHGRIVEQISCRALKEGFETTIVHGARYVNKSQFADIQTTAKRQELLNGVWSFLFDVHGLGLRCSTKSMIAKMDEIKPDVVHLHNIHGYYLNYQVLFDYLAKSGVPVVWTLHDCWSMTGHCSQFENYSCEKWKTQCHDCQYIMDWYPKSLIDRSERNFELKKRCFTSVKNMTIVPVSHWLENVVKQSFLAKYTIKVINNGVDIDKFSPKDTAGLLEKYGIVGKFVVLGVASNWDDDKGVREFVKLSENPDYKVIMIGVNEKLAKQLPAAIMKVAKTNNQEELAEYYSLADVFVNPTYKDTFPTVNLEAMACGTPVITYRTGGSPEAITIETGIVVEKGDFGQLVEAINAIKINGKYCYSASCREKAVKFYNKDDRFKDYIDLYENLIDNSYI